MGANGFGSMVFTQAGLNLLAKAQAGTPLKFTRIAVGDGYLNDQDATQFTQLLNQILNLDIATLVASGPGSATIGAVLSNANLVAGFYWREIGIFAQDPQLGEILYGYDNSSGHEIYVPPASVNSFTAPVNVGVYVSNSASLSAQIDPTLVFATKQDLTTLQPALGFAPINKAGDSMTGPLTLSADPSQALHAATKQYVDATAQGLSIKQSVRVATTGANITLSGTQTIDGVALNAGDRVLVKDQTDHTTNGIYIVGAGAWGRSSDTNTASELVGMFVFVEQGTVNAASGWVLPLNAITLGTTALTYTQFSGAGEIVPGSGISKNGNTLNVTPATAAAIGGVIVGPGSKLAVDSTGKIKVVDGPGSGLDADTVDGLHSTAFATASQGAKADNALPSASYTAADVLAKIKTVDGAGSGLDADTVDGRSPGTAAGNLPILDAAGKIILSQLLNVLSNTAPDALTIGQTGSPGTVGAAARQDHAHDMPTATDILNALKGVDGVGSGLDANRINGLDVQVGAVAISGIADQTSKSVAITFPRAFGSVPKIIPVANSDQGTFQIAAEATQASTTGFTGTAFAFGGASSATTTYTWVALG